MDDKDIKLLSEQEQAYWWHISRRAILQSVLNRFLPTVCHPGPTGQRPSSDSGSRPGFRVKPGMTETESGMTIRKILDVGCGTGRNLQWLKEFGEVVGTDTSELAIKLANHKGRAVLGRAEDLPFEDREFDLVTAFDVLEHLSDESRALGEWGRVLCSGGQIFISVPAHQWLFGPHDRALNHYRRYELNQLLKLLRANNFQPIFSTYIFGFSFPVFVFQRWLMRYSPGQQEQHVNIPNWLNNFLIGLGQCEAKWLHFAKVPWGSSIVVLAKKND